MSFVRFLTNHKHAVIFVVSKPYMYKLNLCHLFINFLIGPRLLLLFTKHPGNHLLQCKVRLKKNSHVTCITYLFTSKRQPTQAILETWRPTVDSQLTASYHKN